MCIRDSYRTLSDFSTKVCNANIKAFFEAIQIGALLLEGLEPGDEVGLGEALHPLLGLVEGLAGAAAGEAALVEVEAEPAGCDFIDVPEGAEDGFGSGFEEGAGEADVFGYAVLFAGEVSFAGGEVDELEVAKVHLGDGAGSERSHLNLISFWVSMAEAEG